MSIADELEKLDELRRRGVLSSEEFEAGKQKILSGANDGNSSRRLDEIKVQNEIAELDREWDLERDNYQVAGRRGRRYIPSKTGSVVGGVVIVAFGIFWTAMAVGITTGASAVMPNRLLGGIALLFPLFGVLFIIAGAVASIRGFLKAEEYDQAQQRYRLRRNELQNKR